MDLSALQTTSDLEPLRSLALHLIAERDAQIHQRDRAIQDRDREIHFQETQIAALTAEIARLRRVQFAARSEQMNPEQRALFDEAIEADIAAVEADLESLRSPSAPRPQVQPKRQALPVHLPRVETRHEPESCTCGRCGKTLTLIGEHVSEKLDCKPLEFFVRRDVHPQSGAPAKSQTLWGGVRLPGL